MIVKRLAQGWVFTSPILNIVYAENTGAAFNILSNSNKLLANLAIVVIFIIFLYLIKNIDKTDKKFLFLLSLFTAGIYGNLYERLTIGYVRDFFEIAFVEFPIFNISDIYITVAVIGLIFTIIFSRKV
jgi:signal peptidase II